MWEAAAADTAKAGAAAPSVHALVHIEAAAMAEALATLAADVERLACMSASVRAQLNGSSAALSAVQAEAAIAAMSVLVS